jgi:hypothetical protein
MGARTGRGPHDQLPSARKPPHLNIVEAVVENRRCAIRPVSGFHVLNRRHLIGSTPSVGRVAHARRIDPSPIRAHSRRSCRTREATGYRGTVHFTGSDVHAVLPANYTFTSAEAGVHTFTNGVTLNTTGAQSVTATDKASGSITGGASVMVTAAAAGAATVGATPGPGVGDGIGGAAVAAAGLGRANVSLGDVPGQVLQGIGEDARFGRGAGLRLPHRGTGRGAGRLGPERRRARAGQQRDRERDVTLSGTLDLRRPSPRRSAVHHLAFGLRGRPPR